MISFKILTEQTAEQLLRDICEAIPDADLEYASETVDMMLEDGECEYAVSSSHGCMLIRIFDGEYSFAYPLPLVEEADSYGAVLEIRAYAVKEEIPLVYCDVPRDELATILPTFRHITLDATDSEGEYYTVRVMSEAMLIEDTPIVNGPQEICLTPLTTSDDELYFRLCTDRETNKYWGYDYSADEPNPTLTYFRENAEAEFNRGNTICLAVRANGEFAGEATLYGFDLLGGCQCAVRLLPEFRHRGYATQSLNLLKRLASSIGLIYLVATVDAENIPSIIMTKKCFEQIESDGERVKFRAEL